jgi:hypothetical protein
LKVKPAGCGSCQPPRENPWIEEIELEESAAPYHDWDERIVAGCYWPNPCSRILDGQGEGRAGAQLSFPEAT